MQYIIHVFKFPKTMFLLLFYRILGAHTKRLGPDVWRSTLKSRCIGIEPRGGGGGGGCRIQLMTTVRNYVSPEGRLYFIMPLPFEEWWKGHLMFTVSIRLSPPASCVSNLLKVFQAGASVFFEHITSFLWDHCAHSGNLESRILLQPVSVGHIQTRKLHNSI